MSGSAVGNLGELADGNLNITKSQFIDIRESMIAQITKDIKDFVRIFFRGK